MTVDELRQILVHDWCLVPADWFANRFAKLSPTQIIEHLAKLTRFKLAIGPVPYLTEELLRDGLRHIHPRDMVRNVGGTSFLKLLLLGRGGQGEVWLACPCDPEAKVEQLVALKWPDPLKPNSTQQLQLEIQTLRKVRNQYVAELVAEDHNSATLATRFVNGVSLGAKVYRQRRLAVAEVLQIGIDVCCALEALHAVLFIHKDVKPGNIVQDRTRSVLIDFGLAEDPVRAPQKLGGTLYYIAPEVFFPESGSRPPDARANVYSLAATLYHLLAGQPPHFQQCLTPNPRTSGAQLDVQRFKLADADIECNLADVRRDVPRALCQLICSALNTDPNQRPVSADSFRASLEDIKKKLDDAIVIEAELWGLSEVLLKIVHGVNRDSIFAAKEQENATAIRNDLEQALRRFPALLRLRSAADDWAGFSSAQAVVTRTVRVYTQVAGHVNQLTAFLGVRYPHTRHFPQLLQDLVVRTLEGLRSISVDALATAHDWRTVLFQLGLDPKPKP